MHGIIKQLPVLGLAAALVALSPRGVLAQETATHDSTAHAAPQDTGAVSGYQGEQRSADSAITDTSAAGDSLGQQDTTSTSRLRPTDTTGAAASPSSGDSALAGDSTAVLPGDSSAIRPDSPRDRLKPTDSTGTENPTQGP